MFGRGLLAITGILAFLCGCSTSAMNIQTDRGGMVVVCTEPDEPPIPDKKKEKKCTPGAIINLPHPNLAERR